MFTVKINDKNFDLELNSNMSSGNINGQSFDLDILSTDNGYHVIRNGKSYQVEVNDVNRKTKEITMTIEGHKITSKVEDGYDALLKSLGMELGASKKMKELKAPMPGLVLEINVKAGDEVKEKDALLILEAMKMENVIKSPTEGTVKNVSVTVGNTVEKNEVLIEFE